MAMRKYITKSVVFALVFILMATTLTLPITTANHTGNPPSTTSYNYVAPSQTPSIEADVIDHPILAQVNYEVSVIEIPITGSVVCDTDLLVPNVAGIGGVCLMPLGDWPAASIEIRDDLFLDDVEFWFVCHDDSFYGHQVGHWQFVKGNSVKFERPPDCRHVTVALSSPATSGSITITEESSGSWEGNNPYSDCIDLEYQLLENLGIPQVITTPQYLCNFQQTVPVLWEELTPGVILQAGVELPRGGCLFPFKFMVITKMAPAFEDRGTEITTDHDQCTQSVSARMGNINEVFDASKSSLDPDDDDCFFWMSIRNAQTIGWSGGQQATAKYDKELTIACDWVRIDEIKNDTCSYSGDGVVRTCKQWSSSGTNVDFPERVNYHTVASFMGGAPNICWVGEDLKWFCRVAMLGASWVQATIDITTYVDAEGELYCHNFIDPHTGRNPKFSTQNDRQWCRVLTSFDSE